MVVSSFGKLTDLSAPLTPASWTSASSVLLYNQSSATYAAMYRTQPNLRVCIEFIGRNIAQLGTQVFRRVSENDRVRLREEDHGLVQTLEHPNPATTRYRLIEATVQDLGTFSNAFWLKVRTPGQLGLVRLPADQMTVDGGLLPSVYTWTNNGVAVDFETSEIVHFRAYDPANPLQGLSPIETLRRVLAEQIACQDYREGYWRNAARMSGVIERPATAPKWSKEQKKQFISEWQLAFEGGVNAGRTPVLEDSMAYKEMSYSAQDSQLIETLKLSREAVAAAYHIPLPMVGILDHATFSNVKEQHKQLYQDCLGPWIVMLQEEIELQLLTEWPNSENVYVEFNINAKLAGSFEEQSTVLRQATGKPFMTTNEARARLNLPQSPRPEDNEIADPTYIDNGRTDEQRRLAMPESEN